MEVDAGVPGFPTEQAMAMRSSGMAPEAFSQIPSLQVVQSSHAVVQQQYIRLRTVLHGACPFVLVVRLRDLCNPARSGTVKQ